VSDRTTEQPSVKYTTVVMRDANETKIEYTFTNISKKSSFDDVKFLFNTNSDKILTARPYLFPPLAPGDSDSYVDNDNYVKLKISDFQPGCKFKITITKTGSDVIPVRYKSKSPMRLLCADHFFSGDYIQCAFLGWELYIYCIIVVLCLSGLISTYWQEFRLIFKDRGKGKTAALIIWMTILAGSVSGQVNFRVIDKCGDGVACDVSCKTFGGIELKSTTDANGFFNRIDVDPTLGISLVAKQKEAIADRQFDISRRSVIEVTNWLKDCPSPPDCVGNIALILSNSDYESKNHLHCSDIDRVAVEATLKACNFSVATYNCSNTEATIKLINSFIVKSAKASSVFFYFSGFFFLKDNKGYISSHDLSVSEMGGLSLNYILENIRYATHRHPTSKIAVLEPYCPSSQSGDSASLIDFRLWLSNEIAGGSTNSVMFSPNVYSIDNAGRTLSMFTDKLLRNIQSPVDTLENYNQKVEEANDATRQYVTAHLSGWERSVRLMSQLKRATLSIELRFNSSKYLPPRRPDSLAVSQTQRTKDIIPPLPRTDGKEIAVTPQPANTGVREVAPPQPGKSGKKRKPATVPPPRPIVKEAPPTQGQSSGASDVSLVSSDTQEELPGIGGFIKFHDLKYYEIDARDTNNVLCHFGKFDSGIDLADVGYQQLQRNQKLILAKYLELKKSGRESSLSALEFAAMGDYFFNESDLQNAEIMYRLSLLKDTNRYNLAGMGQVTLFKGEPDKSLDYCEAAIALGNNKMYSYIGDIYSEKKNYTLSRLAFEKALSFGLKYINYPQLKMLAIYYRDGVGGEKDMEMYDRITGIINRCFK